MVNFLMVSEIKLLVCFQMKQVQTKGMAWKS